MTRLLVAVHELRDVAEFGHALAAVTEAPEDLPQSEFLSQVASQCDLSVAELETVMRSTATAQFVAQQLEVAKRCDIAWGPTLIADGRTSPADNVSAEVVAQMLDAE